MMKVVGVVGSGSGCGKTTLVCALLRAIPGLGAVKISPREDAVPRVEWGKGTEGKDTARFAASGAVAVARIVAPRDSIAPLWEEASEMMRSCRGIIVEGGAEALSSRRSLTILVVGGASWALRSQRLAIISRKSDIVAVNSPTLSNCFGAGMTYQSHFDMATPTVSFDFNSAACDAFGVLVSAVRSCV